MSSTTVVEAVAASISAAAFLGTTAAGGAWWLYQRGGRSGTLRASVETATEAVRDLRDGIERNTEVTGSLSQEFAAHRARVDTLLDEHQRMLVQHDKRLSAVERGKP